MIFNQSYHSAMDSGYYPVSSEDSESLDPVDSGPFVSPDIGLDIKDIGVSTPPMKDQLETLKSRIFQGAKKVELGFTGRGKGSMGASNTTPEMYGKDERMDIRELAKLNKVQLTTHATTEAGSLSGWSQQKFEESHRENTLHEIERAIDFAADTTNGGAIVVHGIEHPRPILEVNKLNNDGVTFEGHEDEETKAVSHLVDQRSGVITQVDRSNPLFEPLYEVVDGTDPNTGDWKGRDGTIIPRYNASTDQLAKRIPKWDGDNFAVAKRDWGYFKDQAQRWNEHIDRTNQAHDKKTTPEKLWFRTQLENNILRTKGSAGYYVEAYDYRGTLQNFKDVDDALKETEKRELSNQEKLNYIQRFNMIGRGADEETTERQTVRLLEQPDLFKDRLEGIKRGFGSNLAFIEEIAGSSYADVERSQQMIDNAVSIEDYSAKKSADTVSKAAIYAMDREKRPSKEGVWDWDVRQGEKFEKPLFIAIENFFPDMNGGHPDEVKRMVRDSRESMVAQLKNRGMSEEDARKQAADRIKATWDTSHANMWRKYFKADPKDTMEQTDAKFKKWYLQKAKEWVDEDIIGHVHVSDNFGWEDEHVVPGQGNAPIKEFIQQIKEKSEKGEIDVIVEPSHNDYRAMLGGWKLFGSSIYGAQSGARDGWAEVESGYFGRSATPYFLYGDAAPDPESWVLWSGTRME